MRITVSALFLLMAVLAFPVRGQDSGHVEKDHKFVVTADVDPTEIPVPLPVPEGQGVIPFNHTFTAKMWINRATTQLNPDTQEHWDNVAWNGLDENNVGDAAIAAGRAVAYLGLINGLGTAIGNDSGAEGGQSRVKITFTVRGKFEVSTASYVEGPICEVVSIEGGTEFVPIVGTVNALSGGTAIGGTHVEWFIHGAPHPAANAGLEAAGPRPATNIWQSGVVDHRLESIPAIIQPGETVYRCRHHIYMAFEGTSAYPSHTGRGPEQLYINRPQELFHQLWLPEADAPDGYVEAHSNGGNFPFFPDAL